MGFSFLTPLVRSCVHSLRRHALRASGVPGAVLGTGASRVSNTNVVSAHTKLLSRLVMKSVCFRSLFTMRKRESKYAYLLGCF